MFKREDRYIVIKLSDLDDIDIPANYRKELVEPIFSLMDHLPEREWLMIEKGWPEYEVVWKMLEDRVGS